MNFGFCLTFSTRWAQKDKLFPLTSFRRADDGWIGVGIRVLLALATIAYFAYLGTIPGLMGDITKAAMKAHDDAKSYGIDKIAFNFTNVNKRSLTHDAFDDILSDEQTDDTNVTASDSGSGSVEPDSKETAKKAEARNGESHYSDTL